jgi:O-Antigen ligase
MSKRKPRRVDTRSSTMVDEADRESDLEFAAWLGERLRRVALGATAALMVARVYWPSEMVNSLDIGGGLVWVFCLLGVVGLALTAALVGGTLRLRFSWADAALIAMTMLIALSVGHAIDRRPAINAAWELGGVCLLYLLVRNLPRTRGESSALAAMIAATAVAVAAYGIYQVKIELPPVQKKYLTSAVYRAEVLKMMNIEPGSTHQKLFENRFLGSNEPFATFALANSLAGFLVGPLVVMLCVGWSNLTRPDGTSGSRWGALALWGFPTFAMLSCLILDKSRSATIGLGVGLMVIAWRERRQVSKRTLLLGGLGGLAVVAVIVAVEFKNGRLDRLVLTESGKSFRYRQEYWIGAWRAINESRRSFWNGYGPANFAAPYVLHKLPEASEDVKDPHNLVLEVWATAGIWAVVALSAAIAVGLWNAFRPGQVKVDDEVSLEIEPPAPGRKRRDPSAPPMGVAWLIGAGALGWILACPPIGGLNPFDTKGEMFFRWLFLGVAWPVAIGCGVLAWRRQPLDPAWLGAAALAILVNLLAAGGIGIPSVALGLWVALALASNLREDRACGRLREAGGRVPAYGLAALWMAFVGTFCGAVTPYWYSQAAMADAADALRSRPPNYERAENAYLKAKDLDKYNPRPWLDLASLDFETWKFRGAKGDDLRWNKVPVEMLESVEPPRPTNSWSLHRERARMSKLLLNALGDKVSQKKRTKLLADVVHASRRAVQLYPANSSLRAWLAEASADIGMIPDALTEGEEALRLDKLTPHLDKKLDPKIRVWLEDKLPEWKKALENTPQLKEIQERLKTTK